MAKSAVEKQSWLFIEDNEWEGERWKRWFEADGALEERLEALKLLLQRHAPHSYSLRQVDEIPESFAAGLEECESLSYDDEGSEDWEEGCGDCGYCSGSEGYYEAEAEAELNGEVLELAIGYYEAQGWKRGGEDPLYKLGLFS